MAIHEDALEMMEGTLSAEAVRRARTKATETITMIRLAELREKFKITQEEIVGFSQPAVSQLEHRKDMKLSTLLSYFSALGLNVEIKVRRKQPIPGVPKQLTVLTTK